MFVSSLTLCWRVGLTVASEGSYASRCIVHERA
jgi:hypothetical protein